MLHDDYSGYIPSLTLGSTGLTKWIVPGVLVSMCLIDHSPSGGWLWMA